MSHQLVLSWLSLSSRTLESSCAIFRLPPTPLSRSGDASGDSWSKLRGDGALEDVRRVEVPGLDVSAAAGAAAVAGVAVVVACASVSTGVDAAAEVAVS